MKTDLIISYYLEFKSVIFIIPSHKPKAPSRIKYSIWWLIDGEISVNISFSCILFLFFQQLEMLSVDHSFCNKK